MGVLVNAGAICKCSFGNAPCTLNVMPDRNMLAVGAPAATIMDSKAQNMPTFGMCSSMANPAVSAATAAAMGALTPQPCQPVITAPWMPGSDSVIIGGAPALTNNSKAMCNWAGVVEIVNPGQQEIML